MTLKSYAKFKGKLTCGLKIDLRNLVNFHASSRTSGNLHFDGFLLTKAYKDLDEKYKRVLFHNNKECPTFGEKLALGSKNDRNLVNVKVNCQQWQV